MTKPLHDGSQPGNRLHPIEKKPAEHIQALITTALSVSQDASHTYAYRVGAMWTSLQAMDFHIKRILEDAVKVVMEEEAENQAAEAAVESTPDVTEPQSGS